MCGIIFLVLGILTLRQGRLALGNKRFCYDKPARIVGILMAAVSPLSVLGWPAFILIAVLGDAGLIPPLSGQLTWLGFFPYVLDFLAFAVSSFAIIAIAIPHGERGRHLTPWGERDDAYECPPHWSANVEGDAFTDRPDDLPRRRHDARIQE
jgi:hypothetical protein